MNSTQDILTRKSQYRLVAVGIFASIVAIATVMQMNIVIGDIDRIAAKQQEQQDILFKSIRAHGAIKNK